MTWTIAGNVNNFGTAPLKTLLLHEETDSVLGDPTPGAPINEVDLEDTNLVLYKLAHNLQMTTNEIQFVDGTYTVTPLQIALLQSAIDNLPRYIPHDIEYTFDFDDPLGVGNYVIPAGNITLEGFTGTGKITLYESALKNGLQGALTATLNSTNAGSILTIKDCSIAEIIVNGLEFAPNVAGLSSIIIENCSSKISIYACRFMATALCDDINITVINSPNVKIYENYMDRQDANISASYNSRVWVHDCEPSANDPISYRMRVSSNSTITIDNCAFDNTMDDYFSFGALREETVMLELSDASTFRIGDQVTGAAGGDGYIYRIEANNIVFICRWNGTNYVNGEAINGGAVTIAAAPDHAFMDERYRNP